MIQEALEYMFGVGKQAADVIVKPVAEPDHVYFIRNPDGKIEERHATPKPRNHKAANLQAIVEMIACQFDEDGGVLEPCEVWCSRDRVTLLIGHDRRDRVDLPLELSLPLRRLLEWSVSRSAIQQAALIKELRITFRGCLAPAGNIVEILRRVKLTLNATNDTEIQHGKSSLGKSITAQVTGADTLPEYVTLQVPIFTNPYFASASHPIECALEPDAATGTFQLIPVPNAIERAIDLGEQRVGHMLGERLAEVLGEKAAAVGVFFGVP